MLLSSLKFSDQIQPFKDRPCSASFNIIACLSLFIIEAAIKLLNMLSMNNLVVTAVNTVLKEYNYNLIVD